MEKSLVDAFGIPSSVNLTQDGIQVAQGLLPRQYITGEVRTSAGQRRCQLTYGQILNKGAHAIIQAVTRIPSVGEGALSLCCKRPVPSIYSIVPEAILQWMASEVLEQAGIHGAIPKVYDIYTYISETRFTMEHIKGMSALEWILKAANPTEAFLHIIGQTAFLLAYLLEHMRLDHRDLKATNLWIRPSTPIHYSATIGGERWTLTSPFQVVLLDFGFACVGDGAGGAAVHLSEDVLPPLDPCPKEGRDLFQLLISLWSVWAVRAAMAADVREWITEALSYYETLSRQTARSDWSYLIVSEPRFQYPRLNPLSLLQNWSSKGWGGTARLTNG